MPLPLVDGEDHGKVDLALLEAQILIGMPIVDLLLLLDDDEGGVFVTPSVNDVAKVAVLYPDDCISETRFLAEISIVLLLPYSYKYVVLVQLLVTTAKR